MVSDPLYPSLQSLTYFNLTTEEQDYASAWITADRSLNLLDVRTLSGTGAMHYGGAHERTYSQDVAIPERDRIGLKRGLLHLSISKSSLSPSTIFYLAWLTES